MCNELYTKLIVNKAFIRVLSDEMDYFDAIFTDPLIDKLYEENWQIKKQLNDKAEIDWKVLNERLDTYAFSISQLALAAYGWTALDVRNAIQKNLPDDLKRNLKKKQSNNEGEM